MQYDNFCFWYAKLLKWTKKDPKEHKDIYEKLYQMGKDALSEYVLDIGATMDDENSVSSTGIPYIELPSFTLAVVNQDEQMPIKVSGRAKINACLGYPGKAHHTKIWITLINVDPIEANSVKLNSLFARCHEISSGVGNSIANIYAKALKQTLSDSDVDYYIEVRTASVVDDEHNSQEFSKLIKKDHVHEVPSPIVRDIRAWANCDKIKLARAKPAKNEYQLVKIGNSMSIMAVNPTSSVAYIGAVSLLDSSLVQAPGRNLDRRKLLHDQFLPTALHLTYAV
jgi:hypothetical protein